jgi:hypothetical protein
MGAFHFSWANVPKVLKDGEIDANQPLGRSFFNSFETHSYQILQDMSGVNKRDNQGNNPTMPDARSAL